jgi:alkylation response protein AidB-like acyl-CoA dehydrogenase
MDHQEGPRLGNAYESDRLLRAALARLLPPPAFAAAEPELRAMGGLATGELWALQRADRGREPVHVPWDAWGRRIDRIEWTPLWHRAADIAAAHGLVALPYEKPHGAHSRLVQAALAYLFTPSSDLFSCPLAMTDGAAAVIAQSRNEGLVERVLPRLVARQRDRMWTSGQWMTEIAGGSDVSGTATVARRDADGLWRLHGRKWFASGIGGDMAMALARPEGGSAGADGLALFCVELGEGTGGLRVDRLKDKLGTRKVPTAELTLDGVLATPVQGLDHGVRAIAPMLNVTRTWNAVASAAYLQRGLALALDFAGRRSAFGSTLDAKPLHRDTLAGIAAESAGALLFALHVAGLLGKVECGEASERDARLLRLLTPIAKLTTARQSVAGLSEVLESFGGAGYVEDTGIPVLLRDAQVFPIWEGTTNVLALDVLRSLHGTAGLMLVLREVSTLLRGANAEPVRPAVERIEAALDRAAAWLDDALPQGDATVESGARRFVMTLGRCMEAALLAAQAQFELARGDGHAAAALRRFVAHGIDCTGAFDAADVTELTGRAHG